MTDTISKPFAAVPIWLCLAGFFLHIILPDPILTVIGFHYSGDEGGFYEKIHPGSYCIFLGFGMLLLMQRSLFKQLWFLFQQYRAAMALLLFYCMAFAYMSLRSGTHGLAFILDTHISAVCCAIILATIPTSTARIAARFFLLIALINSGIGIMEAITKERLFDFDPQWSVLHEAYFRASALHGHPLDNTLFTLIALCVMLHMRFNVFLKTALILFLLASMLAFGGRAGLVFALLVPGLCGAKMGIKRLYSPALRLREFLHIIITLITVPLLVIVVLYISFATGTAERIASESYWDASATSRLLAFHVFDYLSVHDILLGIPTERILDITWRINTRFALSDIENPWLLMFMYMGAVLFPFWLAGTGAFILSLMKNTSLPLQLAVLSYFIIASTANSFGRKDSTYLIMVCAVMCAKHVRLRTSHAD